MTFISDTDFGSLQKCVYFGANTKAETNTPTIYTAQFSDLKGCGDFVTVSMSKDTPSWFKGNTYPPIFTPDDLKEKFINGEITTEQFTNELTKRVLDDLDASKVITDLLNLTDEVQHKVVLCCWGNYNEFCHRHLVGHWLNKYIVHNKLDIPLITEIVLEDCKHVGHKKLNQISKKF